MNAKYEDQVRLATIGTDQYDCRGIKGPSFASEFITLPDDMLIGCLHCCDEGCCKQFLNLFFLPKHNKAPFYLLRHMHTMDKILKLVKYPSELKKTQSTLTAYVHFNANEYRSLINYPLIYILQNQFQDRRYYYHIVKYILFLRLLRQDYVSDIDIANSQRLIDSFLEEFPTLYGTRNLSYNMHANIHLPEQTALHGPSHKRNEYWGENCFKEFDQNYHGTTNIPHQMAENVSVKHEIQSFLTPEEVAKIQKPELQELFNKLHNNKISNKKYLFQIEPLLIKPQTIAYNDIIIDTQLLRQYFTDEFLQLNTFSTSAKVYYNRKCKYTKIYYFYSINQ